MCSTESTNRVMPGAYHGTGSSVTTKNTNTLNKQSKGYHRRKIGTESDHNFGPSKMSKYKCCDKIRSHQLEQSIRQYSIAKSPLNSTREMSSRRNSHRVIVLTAAISCVLISFMTPQLASGFNVDVNSKVVHTAPSSSCDRDCMFGFSVAEHREKGQPW